MKRQTATKKTTTGPGKTPALGTRARTTRTRTAPTTKAMTAGKLSPKAAAKGSTGNAIAPTEPAVKTATRRVGAPQATNPVKVKKPKLVRDSFTIPKMEYAVLDELKQRALRLTRAVKKSELLRAGVKALAAMPDAAFLAALKTVPTIKTGRPSTGREQLSKS